MVECAPPGGLMVECAPPGLFTVHLIATGIRSLGNIDIPAVPFQYRALVT